MLKLRVLAALGIVAVVGGIEGGLSAQTTPVAFDVVSIKPSGNEPLPSGYGRGLGFQPGGRYVRLRMQPLGLIIEAFGVRRDQIDLSDIPGWVSSAQYDIDARLKNTPAAIDQATRDALLKSILIERFKIKTHVEPRTLEGYALVLAKPGGSLGPTLRRSTANYDCDAVDRAFAAGDFRLPAPTQPGVPMCSSSMTTGLIHAGGVTIKSLASSLSTAYGVRARVIDDTQLAGRFDFDLHWTPDRPASAEPRNPAIIAEWPSIFTALEDQLGLKLIPKRIEIDVVVIDHIERPTED